MKRIFTTLPGLGLPGKKICLSSANSINIGRLVPQIVYYFHAYSELLKAGVVRKGEAVDFTVPTGNFGDILAGFYAKEMGLPVRKLINLGFTVLAMNAGLDSGILDPTNRDMLGLIYATEALLGMDDYCMEYIGAYREGLIGPVKK